MSSNNTMVGYEKSMNEETFSICSECLCEVKCGDDGCYCPDCKTIEGDTKEVTQEEWDELLEKEA